MIQSLSALYCDQRSLRRLFLRCSLALFVLWFGCFYYNSLSFVPRKFELSHVRQSEC